MPRPSKDQSVPMFTSSSAALYTCALFPLLLGPESQGRFRRWGASCFHPGIWLIGLQGIKVKKGSKDQIFYLFLPKPPSPGDQELRPPEGGADGT